MGNLEGATSDSYRCCEQSTDRGRGSEMYLAQRFWFLFDGRGQDVLTFGVCSLSVLNTRLTTAGVLVRIYW